MDEHGQDQHREHDQGRDQGRNHDHGQGLAGGSAFERGLVELRPRELDAELVARLEGALEQVAAGRESASDVAARSKIVRFVAPAAAAAAAAVVVLAVVMWQEPWAKEQGAGAETIAVAEATGDGAGGLEPVAAENYLLDARDGEIVLVDGETPCREVFLDYEDSYHWRDPQLETDVRYYQARTEVVYVPVAVY